MENFQKIHKIFNSKVTEQKNLSGRNFGRIILHLESMHLRSHIVNVIYEPIEIEFIP